MAGFHSGRVHVPTGLAVVAAAAAKNQHSTMKAHASTDAKAAICPLQPITTPQKTAPLSPVLFLEPPGHDLWELSHETEFLAAALAPEAALCRAAAPRGHRKEVHN
mmetsp:Transcript_136595/g.265687  ORF Transcript_136595/g.265687 Transcript_136595/m.265687 type:complete len:106 (+) Transcript_136595:49-366(+)